MLSHCDKNSLLPEVKSKIIIKAKKHMYMCQFFKKMSFIIFTYLLVFACVYVIDTTGLLLPYQRWVDMKHVPMSKHVN